LGFLDDLGDLGAVSFENDRFATAGAVSASTLTLGASDRAAASKRAFTVALNESAKAAPVLLPWLAGLPDPRLTRKPAANRSVMALTAASPNFAPNWSPN
jgi:hypothetical protein